MRVNLNYERQNLTPETKIIELLEWAARHGFNPVRPRRNDLFLEMASRRLVRYRDLQPHQLRGAYWIPNQKGLQRLGLKITTAKVAGLTVLRSSNFIGAGPGEHEAALSMVNHMRGEFRTPLAA